MACQTFLTEMQDSRKVKSTVAESKALGLAGPGFES